MPGPGLDQYMAEQQMGQPQPAVPDATTLSQPMSVGSSNMLQPEYDPAAAMKTPLNDRVYSGGQLTKLMKQLLIERAQARAAASAQFQSGMIDKNQQF